VILKGLFVGEDSLLLIPTSTVTRTSTPTNIGEGFYSHFPCHVIVGIFVVVVTRLYFQLAFKKTGNIMYLKNERSQG